MPLEHILAPLLARKAAEIAQATAPAPQPPLTGGPASTMGPRGRGYLAQQPQPQPQPAPQPTPVPNGRKGGEAVSLDNGNIKAPAGPAVQSAKTPFQVFLNSALQSASKQQKLRAGEHVIPDGLPPQVQSVQHDKKKGHIIIKLDPKAAVGVAEDGQSVNARGKKLGYLSQPALVTPNGDVPLRTGDMTQADVINNPAGAYKFSPSPLVGPALKAGYGDALDAIEGNRDANGMPTDQFPAGYLQGKSKAEIDKIKLGVAALKARRTDQSL